MLLVPKLQSRENNISVDEVEHQRAAGQFMVWCLPAGPISCYDKYALVIIFWQPLPMTQCMTE